MLYLALGVNNLPTSTRSALASVSTVRICNPGHRPDSIFW